MKIWWKMPGPSKFLESQCEELHKGSSIVVKIRELGVTGFEKALTDELSKNVHGDRITEIHISPTIIARTPEEVICENFYLDAQQYADMEKLCGSHEIQGQIIIVTGLVQNLWRKWQSFLNDYSRIMKNKCPSERARFLLFIDACVDQSGIEEDLILRVVVLDDFCSLTDLHSYAHFQTQNKECSKLHRNLIQELMVNILSWDVARYQGFHRLELREMIEFDGYLKKIAKERSWNEATELDWVLGTSGSVYGLTIPHAAALIHKHDGKKQIRKRVWKSQLRVIFPFLEELRQEMIQRYKSTIEGNITRVRKIFEEKEQPHNSFKDILELEYTHLLELFRLTNAADESFLRLLRNCREIRNHLAHGETVSAGKFLAMDALSKAQGYSAALDS
jgi:hypothetical protein